MGLTSPLLEYLVIACAAGCVVLTVWQWPRLAARGKRWLLARLGALLLTQALIVGALGLAANAYFDFYGSWADLLGTGGNAPVSIRQDTSGDVSLTGSAALVVPDATGGSLRRFHGLPAGPPQRAGRMESVRLLGRRTGLHQQALVYLPPEYFQPAWRTRRFPVLIAFTGYPGSIAGVVDRLHLPQTVAAQERAGVLRPTVLVIVSQTVAPPRDTECVDVPDGPQVETYLDQDVPDALRSTYRLAPGPRSWGLFGFSAGGSCSLQLAFRHPETFGAAASLSGDYAVAQDATTGPLFASPADRQAHDLVWRLRNLPAPPVRVLVASSRSGERDYRATEGFLSAVRPPLSVSTEILPSGGHNFGTWARELPAALVWFDTALSGP